MEVQSKLFKGQQVWCRVARWRIFKPKIPIWVNFGGSCNERCWYILWLFGIFYGQLVYFVAIWYILWPYRTSSGYLVYFIRFGMLYKKSGNPGVVSVA
jgi:hypothetical protein